MKGIYFYLLATVLFLLGLGVVPGLHIGEHLVSAVKGTALDYGVPRITAYLASLIGVAAIIIGLGFDVCGNWLGVLQSGRNTFSLSRLQMTLWSWLVLSALFAACSCRAWGLGAGALSSALAIDINNDLFAVMGISFFTGAAVPALLALKSQGGDNADAARAASDRAGEPLTVQGEVISRPSDADPRLGDLVQGDDAGTAGTVDLSKVQQLLVTMLLVGVYAVMLYGLFAYGPFGDPNKGYRTVLPTFPPDFVKLLVLSHGGYLAYKALPKPPPSVPAPPPPSPAGR